MIEKDLNMSKHPLDFDPDFLAMYQEANKPDSNEITEEDLEEIDHKANRMDSFGSTLPSGGVFQNPHC